LPARRQGANACDKEVSLPLYQHLYPTLAAAFLKVRPPAGIVPFREKAKLFHVEHFAQHLSRFAKTPATRLCIMRRAERAF